MPEDNSTTVSEEGVTKKSLLKRMFGLYEIIPIVLLLFSIIGIGITDFSPADSHLYWLAMVEVSRVGERETGECVGEKGNH